MTNKKHRLDNLIYVFFNTLKTLSILIILSIFKYDPLEINHKKKGKKDNKSIILIG